MGCFFISLVRYVVRSSVVSRLSLFSMCVVLSFVIYFFFLYIVRCLLL